MSTSDTDTDSPALGDRTNWWGRDDPDPDTPQGHADLPGVSRLEFVARSILLSAADPTLLCPRCHEEADRAAPLSDPEDYVPESKVTLEDGQVVVRYADHRRHRHCTECGYLSWGGILQDRDGETFLAIVSDVLDIADLPASTREVIYRNAQSRKARGMGDQSNMESVIYEIEHPAALD